MANQPDPTKEWWRQFDQRTADLKMAEYGAYRLLVNYCYEYAELPTDRGQLYVIARATNQDDRSVVDVVLHKKFKLDPLGRFRNAEVDAMIARRNLYRNRFDMRTAVIQTNKEIAARRKATVTGKRGAPKKVSLILPDVDPATFPLPPWVPREPWLAWCVMRTERKVTNNLRALQAQVVTLDKLRGAGEDPAGVLKYALLHAATDLRRIRNLGPSMIAG
jgi:uncharacterized protein YdaU (DUF1376 family)